MFIQEQAGCILHRQFTQDLIDNLTISHALLKATAVIAAAIVQARRSREPFLSAATPRLTREVANTSPHPTIFIKERERQPGDQSLATQCICRCIRCNAIKPG